MNWSEKEYNDYAKKMGIPLANAKLKEPLNTAKHQEALNKKGGGAIPHKQNNTKSKYSNKKVLIDGIIFDSKKEANRYTELKILENAGEIINLELQPVYVLQESFKYKGKNIRAIKYIGDFEYVDAKTGKTVLEDTKGFKTKDYLIKVKLLKNKYPDIDFREL